MQWIVVDFGMVKRREPLVAMTRALSLSPRHALSRAGLVLAAPFDLAV